MTVFVLFGKTYSYIDDILTFASKCKAIRVCYKDNMVDGINAIKGTVADVDNLYNEYNSSDVFPVFINTPSEIVLERGLAACRNGDDTYTDMCSRFLAESSQLRSSEFDLWQPHVIDDDDCVCACASFINYVKDIMKGR